MQGFGPFAWQARQPGPEEDWGEIRVPVFGEAHVLVSGGPRGGQIEIEDSAGDMLCPALPAEAQEALPPTSAPSDPFDSSAIVV